MAKKYYFQDLPEESKDEVFENLRERFKSDESIDDFINRHNWARTEKSWLKLKGIE
jgi:hypothetical protein